MDTDTGRVDGRDPAQEPARHRFPLPAVDDPQQFHVAGEFDRDSRIEA